MIKLKVITLFCFLATCCASTRGQSTSTISKIEFTSLTRGYQKHAILSADSLILVTEGREQDKTLKRKLSKVEWNTLISSLKKVKLSEIPKLKSPSMKRAFDGAMHSTLTIITKDQKNITHGFDDEDANEKLRPLMIAVKKIIESNK
jgi:hypothetical protein